MNIQAMMKQAQKLQKEMMTTKDEIEKSIFIGKSSLVEVELFGNKKVNKIKINNDDLQLDEMDLLEDMIVTAINDAMNQIDKLTDEKMGKFTSGMPGLF
ncbi:MAG: YbaB/EbfC family nucleoid-associated protein [Bacilli bacterium]